MRVAQRVSVECPRFSFVLEVSHEGRLVCLLKMLADILCYFMLVYLRLLVALRELQDTLQLQMVNLTSLIGAIN